ncbi:hypothetical protein XENOCAPTIV_009723 [Xenoophorus captivus]|uniref:Pseudouridine synthase RsuA/RluA-like domain-containing protein n=1 Tax=Xenoophorus captivus TaxID=1517983 RepID=A0ABV0R7U9_9TELE
MHVRVSAKGSLLFLVPRRLVRRHVVRFSSSANIKRPLTRPFIHLWSQRGNLTMEQSDTNTGKRKHDEPDPLETAGRGKRRRGAGGKKLRPGERYIPPPQKRNPGVSFSQDHFNETSYYVEGGLRKVFPYYFDFKTYCKGRWVGKSLQEVFKSEFRSESIEYYERAAKEGRIRLNETPVEDLSVVLRVSAVSRCNQKLFYSDESPEHFHASPICTRIGSHIRVHCHNVLLHQCFQWTEHLIRNNDHMRNTVHRHEPPVIGTPLKILVDDGEVLVVDKPASIPVHPCGRFRHNTVIFILGKEHGISELHTVHRLDRLTSGVLLFARTLETSKKLDQMVRERQLEKEYVCRVEGEFPEGKLICEEPILVVSFKIGLCRVDPKGKECRTVFQRLSFNGKTSVVRCLPLTGRTHQIRVHLQYLGFPILNDPIYGSHAWGPHRGKGGLIGKSDEELLQALVEEHRSQEDLHLLAFMDDCIGVTKEAAKVEETDSEADKSGKSFPAQAEDCSEKENSNKASPEEPQSLESTVASSAQKTSPGTQDHLCSECKLVRPDPTKKELIMYLHALRYKGPDFEYSAESPDWAKEDWVETDFS